jgi:hypothetical protein
MAAAVAAVTLAGTATAAGTAGAAPTAKPVSPTIPSTSPSTRPSPTLPSWAQNVVLNAYGLITWQSMKAMADPTTGLPSDNIGGSLAGSTRAKYTSPSNIGMYMLSVVSARDLGYISAAEATNRLTVVMTSVGKLQRDPEGGMLFNWYDPHTLATLTTWPANGNPVYPFVSSIDNAWLASALMAVRTAVPSLANRANALLGPMNFKAYYNPAAKGPANGPGTALMTGGYWLTPPPASNGCSTPSDFAGVGVTVYSTCFQYGSMAETRMVSYVAIALGQIPADQYFALWRTFPDTCDWSWQKQQPTGSWQTYDGVSVFEGTYTYNGRSFVPTWGGSMFEQMMVPLVAPEDVWGPNSWGKNHAVYVKSQIDFGLTDAKYGYWGFSPSSDPGAGPDGYAAFGAEPLGMDGNGYTSDEQQTQDIPAFGTCRAATVPTNGYGDGVVTPHASFLALRTNKSEAVANLMKLQTHFDSFGPGGFYDAVAVKSGTVAKRYLSLDQGMSLVAIADSLTGDKIRTDFATGQANAALPAVVGQENWAVGPTPKP